MSLLVILNFIICYFNGVLGVRYNFFLIYICIFYVLMCVYVSRTRFPSSRAIKDVYL